MRLLAIDPSSTRLGLAFFEFGRLVDACSIVPSSTERRFRQRDLIAQVVAYFEEHEVEHVAIEDPFVQGLGNKVLQRMIGALEIALPVAFTYYAPTSVKKAMGSGKLSKLEMAMNAGEMLASDEEQEILATLIKNEDYDATDAVAIGLTFIKGGNK